MRRTQSRVAGVLLLAAVTALLAAGTALAGAGGAGTVSTTEHYHNLVIDQEQTTNPCTGEDGTITLFLINGVSHLTVNSNGFWDTFTAEGDATFAPDGGTPITGHFATWDGENGNLQNGTATATFSVHLDGITVHETAHWNVSANGIGGVEFDKAILSCH